VTRAALIWKSGEGYRFDASVGSAPECWVPVSATERPGRQSLPVMASLGERKVPSSWKPGVGAKVTLKVHPRAGTTSLAVEELLPVGWEAREISEGGVFDPATRRVRWGVFYGADPRELTYVAVPPEGVACNGAFSGVISADGRNSLIRGAWHVGAADEFTRVRIRGSKKEGERLRFQVEAAEGQVLAVEASSDLVTWTEVGAQVCADGEVEVEDARSGTEAHRYYRLKPVGR